LSFIEAHVGYFPDRITPNISKAMSAKPITRTIRQETNPRLDRSGLTFFDPAGL
jgi:hypothetical protein